MEGHDGQDLQGHDQIDIRDSAPDWAPYEQPKAPDGAPNVIFLVWDDTGFGCGEGLNMGRDGGAPVTDDYPGDRPWGFVGGTIKQMIVDVSGEAYLDLEKEALAMMKRD
jgi:hypothetical protein